jgi:BirA family biotin operon repressor/biotin-[acetyl-CoA-carboxylase] ligase
MSSVAFPADSASSPFISYRVAIAVAETIESQISSPCRCKIKWPNDVYVDEKKIAGILIEQVLCCSKPIWIIGTGINVDVDFSTAPPEVQARAISLSGLQEQLPNPTWPNDDRFRIESMTYILGILIANLWKQLQLKPLDSTELQSEWSKRCMLTGKMVEGNVSSWVEAAGSKPQQAIVSHLPLGLVKGICQGIDENGHLLIQHESGSIGRIITGSVRTIQNGTT